MKLSLRPRLAVAYKSPSQRARVLTGTWAAENLYCLACPADALKPVPTGRRVVDFVCLSCDERYQLKSRAGPFGPRVVNSAYEPKIEAIRMGTILNFLFLQYDPAELAVLNLFAVPRHFISQSIIERRKPRISV